MIRNILFWSTFSSLSISSLALITSLTLLFILKHKGLTPKKSMAMIGEFSLIAFSFSLLSVVFIFGIPWALLNGWHFLFIIITLVIPMPLVELLDKYMSYVVGDTEYD